MFRPIELKDIPKLRTLGVDWTMGEDFAKGLVFVDANDDAICYCGAWKKAEVHLAIDSKWKTPAERLFVVEQMHHAMAAELHKDGFREVLTWFDKVERFCRRMSAFGWVKSDRTSWHRGV